MRSLLEAPRPGPVVQKASNRERLIMLLLPCLTLEEVQRNFFTYVSRYTSEYTSMRARSRFFFSGSQILWHGQQQAEDVHDALTTGIDPSRDPHLICRHTSLYHT
jgi:hypothetical protein